MGKSHILFKNPPYLCTTILNNMNKTTKLIIYALLFWAWVYVAANLDKFNF